jgi:hypothetical protein
LLQTSESSVALSLSKFARVCESLDVPMREVTRDAEESDQMIETIIRRNVRPPLQHSARGLLLFKRFREPVDELFVLRDPRCLSLGSGLTRVSSMLVRRWLMTREYISMVQDGSILYPSRRLLIAIFLRSGEFHWSLGASMAELPQLLPMRHNNNYPHTP